jgi:hypothetical protein
MTTALVVLHVLVMFTAVAISQGPAILLYGAMRRGDVAAIRAVGDGFGRVGRFIGPLFGLGVVIGLTAVFVGGFDPLAPWLVIAYVLTVIAFLTPIVVTGPRMTRVIEAAAASPIDAPSPELRSAIGAAAGPVFWIDAALIVLFIVDMVAKPFSG